MAGIYVHIPYCRQACHYCNFHFSTSLQSKDELVRALVKEINLTNAADPYNTFVCETIYFGGGTPSYLEVKDLKTIIDALYKKFLISADAEITLEANPDDINPETLLVYRLAGINRLSVGIQSFSDEELLWMNRVHTASDSLRCIDEIKEAGFTNFSVDLIYGSPLLSNADWKKNVATVIEKDVPHISAYALTVEPKTALEKMIARNIKAPVNSEKQAEQFLLVMDWLNDAGYEHYEISNYAKPNMRSRHNSSYWQGTNYYGFGPSAHSYNGKSRRWNIASNALYIESLNKNLIPFEEEILTNTQRVNEYIMTSLRTLEGLDLQKINVDFGENFGERLWQICQKYIASEKLILHNTNLVLTKEGKLFADGIAGNLFF